MQEAGKFNPKAIQEAIGQKSVQMTYDTYGKLFLGSSAELGQMMDDYLAAQAEGHADRAARRFGLSD